MESIGGDKCWVIRHVVSENAITKPEEIAIGYGKLIEAGTHFLIIGFTIFLVLKFTNGLRKISEDPSNLS